MNEKLKIYLKTKAILIAICFVTLSCTNDDFREQNQEQVSKKLDFVGYVLPTDSIFKANTVLKNHVLDKFPNKLNELSRTLTSETLGFSIDTTRVMILRSDNFDSYTFTVEREDYNDTELENYVVTYYTNNRYTQFLTSYPILEDSDGTISFDVPNATITSINDSSLLLKGLECVSYAQEWQAGECFDVNCGGSTGSGAHGPDDNCNADTGDQPYTWCTPGTWVNTFCVQYISEDGGGGNGSTTGGGGNTDTTNTNNDDEDYVEFPTVPLDDELGLRKECKKAKFFLDNNPNFKTVLLTLDDDTDIDYETSISKFENEPTIIADQGESGEPEVKLLNNPTEDYQAYAHYHYETTTTPEGDTYSVFSIDDLVETARLLSNEYLDHKKFVTYLSTGKGTHYALTINNKARFLKAFDYVLNPEEPDPNTSEASEILEWSIKQKKWFDLKDKFYDAKDAPIKVTNIDNDAVLGAFLQFMSEADMGVSMFKTDENFNEFTRVTYDAFAENNIKEKPCNN